MLSYIPFLHQTTTGGIFIPLLNLLSYIPFLHQTTTIVEIYAYYQLIALKKST